MSLTKIEIVNMLYDHIGITKTECVNLFESVFEIIKDELGKGNPVKISRFGKWTVNTFKPSTILRDAVND
ncbi:MAG: HU family DNA-binding protein [Deltaproteobacteria bacterium]|nr:HU family DNA-binding protein [Deltaproteobacteria bacterium]